MIKSLGERVYYRPDIMTSYESLGSCTKKEFKIGASCKA